MTTGPASSQLADLPARAVPMQRAQLALRYSFVTLVTSPEQYSEMVRSFVAKGFTSDKAEFLYADNSQANQFDGYTGLNRLIEEARGHYIICLHQDVFAYDDGIEALDARLAELDHLDPDWGVAANAGRSGRQFHLRLNEVGKPNQHHGPFPQKVDVVDENFFILRRDRLVTPSFDLHGFHLYGLDVVMQAQAKGLSAYVIDFLVDHHGAAHVDETYLHCRDRMEAKINHLWRSRQLPTMVEDILLSGVPHRFAYLYPSRSRRRKQILKEARQRDAARNVAQPLERGD